MTACRLFPLILLMTSPHLPGAGLLPPDMPLANCGYSSAATCLALHGVEVEAADLVRQLNAGEMLERSVSLLDLKQTLERAGLGILAFKRTDADELIGWLGKHPGLSAVVHLQGERRSHFFVVHAHGEAGGVRLVLYNYPDAPQTVQAEQLRKWLEAMSGHVLLVRRDTAGLEPVAASLLAVDRPAPRSAGEAKNGQPVLAKSELYNRIMIWPDGVKAPEVLPIRGVPHHAEVFHFHLPVENRTEEPVVIDQVTGSCSCFRGAELPLTVRPKSKARLRLQFSTAHFRRSRQSELVIGSKQDGVLARILAKLANDDGKVAEAELYVVRRWRETGALPAEEADGLELTFPFLMPREEAHGLERFALSPKPGPLAERLGPVREVRLAEREFVQRDVIVTLPELPPGPFEFMVPVFTRHPTEGMLTLHVRGSVLP